MYITQVRLLEVRTILKPCAFHDYLTTWASVNIEVYGSNRYQSISGYFFYSLQSG